MKATFCCKGKIKRSYEADVQAYKASLGLTHQYHKFCMYSCTLQIQQALPKLIYVQRKLEVYHDNLFAIMLV